MKKAVMVCTASVLVILGGILVLNNWNWRGGESHMIGIEGYSSPEIEGTRVEELVIEKHVARSLDKRLQLVTLAPGSGWLKLITRDQISPVLHFRLVSRKDIKRFNNVSESIGYPFRTKLVGRTLYIQHIRNHKGRAPGGDTVAKAIDIAATKERRFFELDDLQPRVVMARNKAGKIFLVEVKDIRELSGTYLAENAVGE